MHLIPRIIAHRGASGHAPENTLAAMQKAKALGVEWVEFDVMLSSCGTPIIIHDETLKRTTQVRSRVAQHSYQQLARLDAGSWFSAEYKNERIPTLEQMLLCLRKLQLRAVVEIKPLKGEELVTARLCYRLLQQLWPERLSETLLASFSSLSLQALRELSSDQPLGYAMHRWDKHWHADVAKYNCATIHVNQRILTNKRLQQLKTSHCPILAYTVNRAKRAKKLFSWGLDGVFTDYPERIQAVL
jgi:glycerophosphoryl diester phosphodiesterase